MAPTRFRPSARAITLWSSAPRPQVSITQGAGGYPFAGLSGTDQTGLNFGNFSRSVVAIGLDQGGPPTVIVRDTVSGQVVRTFIAFNPAFSGGVRRGDGPL